MITKSDLQAVLDEMRVEDRERGVEPPTVEEMLAFRRGELSDEKEARVRGLLVCYPELLRALMTPYPDDDAQPGDPGYLPPEKLEEQWASMRKHIQADGGRVVQFWRAFSAIAATVAITFGGLFWNAQRELLQPRALSEQELLPNRVRGGGDTATTLSGIGDAYVLVPRIIDERPFDSYRLEIADPATNPAKTIWNKSGVRQRSDDSLAVVVPRSFLKPGKYDVLVYGVNGEREELLGEYTIRVPTTAH